VVVAGPNQASQPWSSFSDVVHSKDKEKVDESGSGLKVVIGAGPSMPQAGSWSMPVERSGVTARPGLLLGRSHPTMAGRWSPVASIGVRSPVPPPPTASTVALVGAD
jgi:hypothetical protein